MREGFLSWHLLLLLFLPLITDWKCSCPGLLRVSFGCLVLSCLHGAGDDPIMSPEAWRRCVFVFCLWALPSCGFNLGFIGMIPRWLILYTSSPSRSDWGVRINEELFDRMSELNS